MPQPDSSESDGFSVSDVLFRHIEQRGNQCVWMLDVDGNSVYVNDGLAELLGYSVAEMMSLNLVDLLDESGKAQGAAFLALQRETGGTRDTSDTLLMRRDGVPIWISINHGPWNSDDGRYLGLVFFVTDVTDRRRLHDELQQREDQLARTQHAAGLGSWEWDIARDEVRWSDELYRILGLLPTEVEPSFEAHLSRIHPDDRQRALDTYARCLSGEPDFEFDQRVVRADGTIVWVRASGELLRGEDGQPVRMRGSELEIGPFKEAEARLQRTTDRYQLLQTMASAANGANGLAEVVELAAREMCAHQSWPAGRAYVVSGDPPQLISESSQLALDAFSTGQPRWNLPDGPDLGDPGHPSSGVDFAFPVQYEGGVVAVLEFATGGTVRPDEAVGLCEQVGTQLVRVAERELASRELTAARDAALAAVQAKSAFLATMSHEIRTPMNGVIGLTDLLLGSELTDRQRQYAEGVHGAGEALLAIINDILDFSKIEAGRLELEAIDFDVTQIVEEVAGLVARQAHSKGLELISQASLGLATTLRGDPARLRQVLLNLASNGIKFTEQGEVMLRPGSSVRPTPTRRFGSRSPTPAWASPPMTNNGSSKLSPRSTPPPPDASAAPGSAWLSPRSSWRRWADT